MKFESRAARGRYETRRALAGFGGVAVGCVALTAVVILFGEASSMSWLPGTPSNIAAMQACDGVAGTAARRVCAEAVIAQVRSRDSGRRLATREPAAYESPPTN